MSTLTVAVLGAGGTMGTAMSSNLLRAGHRVHAWNSTAGKAQPLRDVGAVIFDAGRGAREGLMMARRHWRSHALKAPLLQAL